MKQRLKEMKIRFNQAGQQQVVQFNTNVQPELILDHNDPYKVEWLQPNQQRPPLPYVVGKDVKRLSLFFFQVDRF